MRDLNRIDTILVLLEKYWLAHPDLRLAQVIGNANHGADPYYLEDTEIEKYLREQLKEKKNG